MQHQPHDQYSSLWVLFNVAMDCTCNDAHTWGLTGEAKASWKNMERPYARIESQAAFHLQL